MFLRRIMRRGMRHAHTLGSKNPIFYKLFDVLLKRDVTKLSRTECEAEI